MSALLAGIFPSDFLAELTSVGTLFAFFMTNIGVLILRLKKPDYPRKFKVPFGPYVVPLLGALICLALISLSSVATLIRLFVWIIIGIVIYMLYGRHHSKLKDVDLSTDKVSIEKEKIHVDMTNDQKRYMVQPQAPSERPENLQLQHHQYRESNSTSASRGRSNHRNLRMPK